MRWISNVRLPRTGPCSHGGDRRWRVAVDDGGWITAVEPIPAGSSSAGENWSGDWLSPAGVDLQINGGLGLAFPNSPPPTYRGCWSCWSCSGATAWRRSAPPW